MTYYFFFVLTVGVLLMVVFWGVRAEIEQEKQWESDKRRLRAGIGVDGRASTTAARRKSMSPGKTGSGDAR